MTPSTALVAYAESLLDGRRVVVFGDCSTPLADELVERGARVVHLFDVDAARVGEAAAKNRSRNVSYAPLAEVDVAVRDGAFDVALVPNLAAFPDGAELVRRVQRALSTRGVALFAAPNPEVKRRSFDRTSEQTLAPLGYYDLYDLVSGAFDEVRMLGQTPFVGYAVVDFAQATEPDISFDSGFVPGGAEEPEWYVAVASARAVELEAFMVIQLPASLARPVGAERAAPEVPRARALDALVAERDAKIAELGRDAQDRAAELADRDAALRTQHAELERLRVELTERDAALERTRDDYAALQATCEALRADLARPVAPAAADSAEQDQLNQRIAELETEIAEKTATLTARQERIFSLEADVARNDATLDYAALEAALAERAGEIRRLQQELTGTERTARDIVARVSALTRQLEERRSESNTSEAAPRSGPKQSPAREAAEREADLQAARWTIEELETLLEARDGVEKAALSRQLAEARAELQRQQALLNQLERAGENPAMAR